jgi:hypothetical protein
MDDPVIEIKRSEWVSVTFQISSLIQQVRGLQEENVKIKSSVTQLENTLQSIQPPAVHLLSDRNREIVN